MASCYTTVDLADSKIYVTKFFGHFYINILIFLSSIKFYFNLPIHYSCGCKRTHDNFEKKQTEYGLKKSRDPETLIPGLQSRQKVRDSGILGSWDWHPYV